MNLTIETEYVQKQTDCRLCSACQDMILTNMFQLVVTVGDERIESENYVYCEHCYQLIDDGS
jgi:hypothetical protein